MQILFLFTLFTYALTKRDGYEQGRNEIIFLRRQLSPSDRLTRKKETKILTDMYKYVKF